MKIRRRTTWEAKRSDWYRDAARTRARESIGLGTVMLVIASILLTLSGAREFETWTGVASVIAGVAGTALGMGLWLAQRWALRIGGMGLLGLVVAGVVALPTAVLMGHEIDVTDFLLGGFYLVSLWTAALDLLRYSRSPVVPEPSMGSPQKDPSS